MYYIERSGTAGMKWYHRHHQSYATKPTRSGRIGEEHGEAARTKSKKRNPVKAVGRFLVNDIVSDFDMMVESFKHPIKHYAQSLNDAKKYNADVRQVQLDNYKKSGIIKGIRKNIDNALIREKSYRQAVMDYNKIRKKGTASIDDSELRYRKRRYAAVSSDGGKTYTQRLR